MPFESFIARRLYTPFSQGGKKPGPAVRIAVIGIAIGVVVILVAVSVVHGFKRELEKKIIGVSAHIQISSYYSNNTFEQSPVTVSDSLIKALESLPGVSHAQCFYTKPGMIKTPTDFQVVVFKGVDQHFDPSFIKSSLVDGYFPDYRNPSNEVVISQYLADLLNLKRGDSFLTYFIRDEAVSARKFTIAGLYNTHFPAFDKQFLLVDARHIRRLNEWEPEQAGGIELFFHSMNEWDTKQDQVYEVMSQYANSHHEMYFMRNLKEMYPDLFGWLNLLNMNVWLILCLMIFVSGFNIISGLLILILERTNMIGVLKALGATNREMRRLFLFYATYLIAAGLVIGDVIGIGLCWMQDKWHLLKLDPAIYYVDAVPIDLNGWYVLLINAGAALVSLLVVMIPTQLVSHIHPAKAIRFD